MKDISHHSKNYKLRSASAPGTGFGSELLEGRYHHVLRHYVIKNDATCMMMASSSSVELEPLSAEVQQDEQAPKAVTFHVGETFASYVELHRKIELFEKKNFIKLWKRDSRSVAAARKRINRALSDKIKYYEVTFCCLHGGKKFKARGEGLRSTK